MYLAKMSSHTYFATFGQLWTFLFFQDSFCSLLRQCVSFQDHLCPFRTICVQLGPFVSFQGHLCPVRQIMSFLDICFHFITVFCIVDNFVHSEFLYILEQFCPHLDLSSLFDHFIDFSPILSNLHYFRPMVPNLALIFPF